MLKPKSAQELTYRGGCPCLNQSRHRSHSTAVIYTTVSYQSDHLFRKINQVVDFSFVSELVKDRYTPDFGRPAEDPEFMIRLCLL